MPLAKVKIPVPGFSMWWLPAMKSTLEIQGFLWHLNRILKSKMLFVVGAERMVCEVSVLNPSSHELHIIKSPFSYLYLSSLRTFSFLGGQVLSFLSPYSVWQKTALVPCMPCVIWTTESQELGLSLRCGCSSSAPSDSQINTLHFHQAFHGQRRCFHSTDVEEAVWQCMCRSRALQAPQLLLVTPAPFHTGIAKKQRGQ